MSETASIVGIYGAIDRTVQVDSAARARVAQLLRPYRNPNVHWYDDFLEWTAGTDGENGDAAEEWDPHEIVAPLTALGETGASGRTRARRLFAIALVKRAYPDMHIDGVDLRELAIHALRAPEGEGAEPVEAVGLYELLAGGDGTVRAGAPHGGGWWTQLITTALSQGFLPDKIGMFPQPCSGRLLTVPGVAGPVAALKTEHETEPNEIKFKAATRFLEPVNWEKCMPDFWCDMSVVQGLNLPPGQRRYHEIVSTHCADKGQLGFWAETELLFDFMWLPDEKKARAAVANYQLPPGRPLPNDRILVDEGTLLVEKVEGTSKLKITTTKRVKFNYPFMTEALALVMCALGYADTSGGLLCCAARYGRDFTGTPFPGVPAGTQTAAATARAAGAGGSRSSGPGELYRQGVDIWARSMRDWANVIERGTGGLGPAKPRKTPRKKD